MKQIRWASKGKIKYEINTGEGYVIDRIKPALAQAVWPSKQLSPTVSIKSGNQYRTIDLKTKKKQNCYAF
jgi:hypothetical protein